MPRIRKVSPDAAAMQRSIAEPGDEAFRSFMEAEMQAILASMDEADRTNNDICNSKAIDWIERNAARFRRLWSEAITLTPDGTAVDGPRRMPQ